ncbi:Programmed cell death protein 4 [Papilio xuthus]|uniref:Programmed cell death protein 4 n=1 Tax=Papilio xuthus TaxID=66420 RepID=A0A0N0PAF5_PAPXU|nr:Programmed cell death protein 4 [Papilio xuthus]
MEVDRIASDSENVAVDENDKSVVEGGAGDAASSHTGRIKRKNRKYGRSNSKEAVGVVSTPLPKYRSWKNSRRPRNGHGRGLPKKGGAGGKGVWGAPGCELLEEYVEDANDPNYDSEAVSNGDIEFKQVIVEADPEEVVLSNWLIRSSGAGGKGVWGAPGCELLEEYVEDANDPNYDSEAVSNGDIEFKQVIVEADPEEVVRKSEPVILEYFEHGDTNAAAEDLLEFVTAKRSHLVCETIVEIALDHKPSHCEMASVLISDLYGRIFSAKDIAYAFERLMEKLPDLVLDTPDAAVLLSNFIARCVADDCLPPRFVHTPSHKELNSHARQAIQRAETLLSMKQGLVRLDNIWGVGGGIRPVKWLIRQIQLLLKEYLTSGDLAEAMRCVRELEVPHFHHELVYETVLLAVEAINSSVEEQLCTFLAELRRCVIVTPDQMDRSCFACRGRKRFVSEGDGGAIKDHALKLRE